MVMQLFLLGGLVPWLVVQKSRIFFENHNKILDNILPLVLTQLKTYADFHPNFLADKHVQKCHSFETEANIEGNTACYKF